MHYRLMYTGKESTTADNFFTGQTSPFAVATGQKMNGTVNRGNLGKLKPYLHHARLQNGGTKTVKLARYYPPIVVTCPDRVGWLMVSMQSTGATNFVSTNMFHEINNYTKEKPRGKNNEFGRNIECNEARQHYLTTYWSVDATDRQASRRRTQVISLRNHINSTLGGRDYAAVVAHDKYIFTVTVLAEREPSWRAKNPRNLDSFMQKLSVMMCQFNPADCFYPGCEKFRAARKRGATSSSPAVAETDQRPKKTQKTVDGANKSRARHQRALCSTLPQFLHHGAYTRNTRGYRCAWCGQVTAYYGCKAKMCQGLSFCHPSERGVQRDCHAYYHCKECDGLGFCDVEPDERKNLTEKRTEFKSSLWETNIERCEKAVAKSAVPQVEAWPSRKERDKARYKKNKGKGQKKKKK